MFHKRDFDLRGLDYREGDIVCIINFLGVWDHKGIVGGPLVVPIVGLDYRGSGGVRD
jgi:hypothetical protein